MLETEQNNIACYYYGNGVKYIHFNEGFFLYGHNSGFDIAILNIILRENCFPLSMLLLCKYNLEFWSHPHWVLNHSKCGLNG